LERALQSGQVLEQRAAAEALAALIRVVDQLSKDTRSDSRGEVGEVGGQVVPAASRGLQNPDPEVRRKCGEALRQAAVALGELVPLLQPYEEEVKEIPGPEAGQANLLPLAKALGDQGDVLAHRLEDSDAQIRLTAAHTLEEIGNARARLLRLEAGKAEVPPEKKDGKPARQGEASMPANPAEVALFRGLRAAIPALSKSLSDSDPEVRLAAVEVFETLGSDASSAADALTRALTDRNAFVRWAAARALANIDATLDPKAAAIAVPGLARGLFDPDLNTRLAAAATLEKYGPAAKEAVPEMARAVGVGDAEIRVAVIRALEAVDPADAQPAVPALSQALTNPADRVRRAAAEALGRLGPLARDAEPALRRALDDPEDLVRKAAAEALINLNLKK
jgi:HEAT repeat protein